MTAKFTTTNPATGQLRKEFPTAGDCCRNFFADNDQIQAIIADDRVRGASLNGSEGAGAAAAGAPGTNSHCSLP